MAVRAVLDRLAGGQGFPSAFRDATGSSAAAFEEDLRAHLAEAIAAR
jgi:hypothetical protein